MQSFRNSNGKVIGTISGNVFEKCVKKSIHLLSAYSGA